MKKKATKTEIKVLRSIFLEASKPYRGRIYVAWALMMCNSIMAGLLTPYIVSKILGDVAQKSEIETFREYLPWIYWLIAFELIGMAARRGAAYLEERFDAHCRRNLVTLIFEKLLEHPLQFHQNRFVGKTIALISKSADCFGRTSGFLLFSAVNFVVMTIGMGVILIPRIPVYYLIVLIVASLYLTMTRRLLPGQLKLASRASEVQTKIYGVMSDAVTNISAVKAETNESEELDNVLAIGEDWLEHNKRYARRVLIRDGIFSNLSIRSLRVLCVVFALVAVMNGTSNVDTVYLATTLTLIFMIDLWQFADNLFDVTVFWGDAAPIVPIMNARLDVADIPDAVEMKRIDGNIELKNVTFAYPNQEQPVFSELSLSIKPHERVGIVGRSGAGKSSLVKILMRFVDINSGEILFDGKDIAKVTQDSLRSQIAYVPQEPILFHRTVRENITYGIDDVTNKTIEDVLVKSHSDEFVAGLPKGLDSIVGERGVNLSGGQRQRISIARAMLKDAPILILDEATSALDSESEQYVQAAFAQLTQERTTLVIAHRLSTLMDMDRIIVFDFGEIIEEGTHEELLQNKSMYAQLWKHQAGGFLPEA